MRYSLKTVADTPWGSIDAPTVTCTHWGVSCSTGSHIDGAVLNVYNVLTDENGRATGDVINHDLDNTTYPTEKDAQQAAYEAGLLAYWIKQR